MVRDQQYTSSRKRVVMFALVENLAVPVVISNTFLYQTDGRVGGRHLTFGDDTRRLLCPTLSPADVIHLTDATNSFCTSALQEQQSRHAESQIQILKRPTTNSN